MKVRLKDLYIEFFLLGIQLLGGGYVIVPLIQQSIINKHHWITNEELTDYYAISQSIPGIIAANISTFTGYKLRGKSGAAAAVLGIATSPIIAILTIATLMDKLLNFPFIQSIFWGAGVAVVILLYLSIKEIWHNSVNDIFSWGIFIATIILSLFFNISPTKIVIGALIFGITYKYFEQKRSIQ